MWLFLLAILTTGEVRQYVQCACITDENFKMKVELKVHLFIFITNTVLTGSAVSLGVFNTSVTRSYCHFSAVPLGCRDNADVVGECDPLIKNRVNWFLFLDVVVLFLKCVL